MVREVWHKQDKLNILSVVTLPSYSCIFSNILLVKVASNIEDKAGLITEASG